MRFRPSAAGIFWLLCLEAACGTSAGPAPDPGVIPRQNWGTALAAVECGQIFGCCDSAERMHFGYVDEGQCRKMLAAKTQKDLDQIIADGLVVYDGEAARRCLDESVVAACSHIAANASVGIRGPSCPHVTRGALPLGAACEDLDFICESSNCLPGPGTCGPPRACPASCVVGQYCDATAGGCVPVKAEAAVCASNVECDASLVCRLGVCGGPLPDGATCSSNSDCVNGACIRGGPTTAACGAPLPDGAPCGVSTECASDNCASTGTGSSACGTRFCDGV
jgi:Dickkopf N-terminal cysteine-rich region